MPQRIQRKRTKGWRMPNGVIYVGRPSFWANPFKFGGNDLKVRMFRNHFEEFRDSYMERISELRGKDLACWCPLDQPCHADVLLEIANSVPALGRQGEEQ